MDQQIVQSAIEHYADSSTEDLLALWLDNDPDLLSQEGFEAIRRILSERLDSIPEQVDWEELNARRSIDVSDCPANRPPPVPAWYRPATSKTRRLQIATVACAVLGFVILTIYMYLWRHTDLFNVTGLILSIGLFVAQVVLKDLARHLWVRSKQLRIPQIADVAVNRNQPPIIYLRPFVADYSTVSAEPRLSGIFGLGILQHVRQPTFEEMMVAALDQDGPILAIGRPGERYGPVGAIREYPDPQKWHERIIAMIEQAQIVILVIGTSEGLLFELEAVYKRRRVRNLILVWDVFSFGADESAVDLKTAWADFRLKFEEITDIDLPRRIDFGRSLLLCFLPSQDLRLIVGKRRTAEEWYAAFRAARNLVVGKEPGLIRGKRQRQLVPWIICVWYYIGFIASLAAYRSAIITSIPLILDLMNLTAAILLFMRRRLSVWLFAASLAIYLLNGVMTGGFVRPPSADILEWIASILLGYGVPVAILIYSWRLLKLGVLR